MLTLNKVAKCSLRQIDGRGNKCSLCLQQQNSGIQFFLFVLFLFFASNQVPGLERLNYSGAIIPVNVFMQSCHFSYKHDAKVL